MFGYESNKIERLVIRIVLSNSYNRSRFFVKKIENFSIKNIYLTDILKFFISAVDIKAILIAFILIICKDLKILDLKNNEIGNLGIKIFSKTISNKHNLKILDLFNFLNPYSE